MQREQAYFYSFMYLVAVIWLAASAVIVSWRLARRGKAGVAVSVVLCSLVADLLLFCVLSLQDVTLPWTAIGFNERAFSLSFPQHRLERPFLHKDFPNFSASLKGEFAAFDNSSYDRCPLVYRRITNVSRMLNEMRDGTFALQKEVSDLPLSGFVDVALQGYESWHPARKFAYLSMIEVALEDITFQKGFYSLFKDARPLAYTLRKGVLEGYAALGKKTIWQTRESTLRDYQRLLQLQLELEPEFIRELSPEAPPEKKQSFLGLLNNHVRLYKTMSCLDYFLNLWDRYVLETVNTYVRLKDFDTVVRIYDNSVNKFAFKAVTKKIAEDAGVSVPLVRFFSGEAHAASAPYSELLKEGTIREGTLYVEQPGGTFVVGPAPESVSAAFHFEVKEYAPNYLRIACKASVSGYLYYSDCYDRYWKALVDRKAVPLYKANGAFKAVYIPAGTSIVEFRYDPRSFKCALYMYYSCVIICVLVLIKGSGILHAGKGASI